MSVNSKMTAIADKIRALLGITGAMSLDAMAAHLDTEKANVTAALAAIAEKGVTVDDGSNSDDLATLIAAIEAGGGDVEMVEITPVEENVTLTVPIEVPDDVKTILCMKKVEGYLGGQGQGNYLPYETLVSGIVLRNAYGNGGTQNCFVYRQNSSKTTFSTESGVTNSAINTSSGASTSTINNTFKLKYSENKAERLTVRVGMPSAASQNYNAGMQVGNTYRVCIVERANT